MRAAGTETARFAVNSTVGIAGLWDPALRWLDLQPAPEDFGQVFGRWGWDPSTYLVLPIFGPSTIRDGVGLIPDAYLDPATYFFPAGPVLSFNDQVDSIPEYRRLVKSSFDPYDDAQLLWTVAREDAIHDDAPVDLAGDDTGAVQTLEAVFFGPKDPGFVGRLDTREVYVRATGKSLPYSYRIQPRPAPIVFVVPGPRLAPALVVAPWRSPRWPGIAASRSRWSATRSTSSSSNAPRACRCRAMRRWTRAISTACSTRSRAISPPATATASERASSWATRSARSTASTSRRRSVAPEPDSSASIATCCSIRRCG